MFALGRRMGFRRILEEVIGDEGGACVCDEEEGDGSKYIFPPGSCWAQISNIFFFASGFFNDLLCIRLALVFAFFFLGVQAALGLPFWEFSFGPFTAFCPDILVWASLNLFLVHGPAVLVMYWDERDVSHTLSDDQKKLWRFIYRHSGLSMGQYAHLIAPTLELKSFKAGENVPVSDYFYVILDGMFEADIKHHDHPDDVQRIQMYSGELFPLVHMYNDYMPTDNFFGKQNMKPFAACDSRAFAIPLETLHGLGSHPDAKETWIALLIATLATIAEKPFMESKLNTGSEAQIEESRRIMMTNENSLFDPLQPAEEPEPNAAGSGQGLKHPIAHLWYYMKLTFIIPWPLGHWPVGLRHSLPPPQMDKEMITRRLSAWASTKLGMSGRSGVGSMLSHRSLKDDDAASGRNSLSGEPIEMAKAESTTKKDETNEAEA